MKANKLQIQKLTRVLNISPLNVRLEHLIIINKIISNITYNQNSQILMDHDKKYLNPQKLAKWIKENIVLKIDVLESFLRQPRCVEKLEKILRFVIKEKTLTLRDLDVLWEVLARKHDATIKNGLNLVKNLALDFSPDQLVNFFKFFHAHWTDANNKQRKYLLEFIRMLAKADKNDVKANKVLMLLWTLDHEENLSDEIIQQALFAQLKIMDYSCKQNNFSCLSKSNQGNLNDIDVYRLYFTNSQSQNVYNLEVLYSNLLSAEETPDFQTNILTSICIPEIIKMLLSDKLILKNDQDTKRSIYLIVFKISTFLLCVIGQIMIKLFTKSVTSISSFYKRIKIFNDTNKYNFLLKAIEGFRDVLYPKLEIELCSITSNLAQRYIDKISNGRQNKKILLYINKSLSKCMPTMETIWIIIQLSWSMAGGNQHLFSGSLLNNRDLHKNFNDKSSLTYENIHVCKEALEVLNFCLLLKPNYLSQLMENNDWKIFIIDLILLANNSFIRRFAAQQFLLIVKFSWSVDPLLLSSTISFMFSVLNETVLKFVKKSKVYFYVISNILNFASSKKIPDQDLEMLLNKEIKWLKCIREKIKTDGDSGVEEIILQGHLNITNELVQMISYQKRTVIGSDETAGIMLIKELLEDFIFSGPKLMEDISKQQGTDFVSIEAICKSPLSTNAAFNLIISLCVGCVSNLKLTVEMLTQYFYSEHENPFVMCDPLLKMDTETAHGFVGLRNAGATCYMNSVLQQLYMALPIRSGILSANVTAIDISNDYNSDDKINNEIQMDVNDDCEPSRKVYNVVILNEVQTIFQHLILNNNQCYAPKGLWNNFKIQGLRVNIHDQHDAVEFFTSIVESLDEGFKALNQDQIMSKILGGSFSDQKICQDCPHRYSKEEPFNVISVDIKNHLNLTDSLKHYVKGELLEGVDAYHCSECNKKVVTVKRLCVKKLPSILAIQLKRFSYDIEKQCAIKCNDYFEFPRDLDMEPYTVSGLAKIEDEIIDGDFDELQVEKHSQYQLTGIVVHSGKANGGHYYSYIQDRSLEGSYNKWYTYDDATITECKIDIDEEMKTQCFGGDYVGKADGYENNNKTRFWNAYMLFYTKIDSSKELIVNNMTKLSMSDRSTSNSCIQIPLSFQQQNIWFSHNRNLYTKEYFKFIQNIAKINTLNTDATSNDLNTKQTTMDEEKCSLMIIQLVSKFIIYAILYDKKSLRGNITEWYDLLSPYFRKYVSIRAWFAQKILFNHHNRFLEYLLQCMDYEIQLFSVELITCLAYYSKLDDAVVIPTDTSSNIYTIDSLSDQLIITLLKFCSKMNKHTNTLLPHYFKIFSSYRDKGWAEKQQLLKLNVAELFVLFTIVDGLGGQSEKHDISDFSELFNTISILVRCYDCMKYCTSFFPDIHLKTNPYAERESYVLAIKVNPIIEYYIFEEICYFKTLIKYQQLNEESIKLLQFVCWENINISIKILTKIIFYMMYKSIKNLTFYFDLLNVILSIEDSWQMFRTKIALYGEKNGSILDIILYYKLQKRSYHCIEGLVHLFKKIPIVSKVLKYQNLQNKWMDVINLLQELNETLTEEELNRCIFLSTSIRNVLQNAYVLYPFKEVEYSLYDEDKVNTIHVTNTTKIQVTVTNNESRTEDDLYDTPDPNCAEINDEIK